MDWQRAASVVMARGDSEAGLRAYAAEHWVELVAGAEAAQTRVIAAWTEQRARYGDDVLIVTRRNADAAALNARARAALRAEGQLGPDLITPPARDREDRLVPLALALGDHLRFGESLPHLGLRNGTRARIEAITAEPDGSARLRLALEDGRVIEVAWDELRRNPGSANVRHTPRSYTLTLVQLMRRKAGPVQRRWCTSGPAPTRAKSMSV